MKDINVICLVKGSERYVWLYEDHQAAEVRHSFASCASRQDTTFSWYDVVVMSRRVREITEEANK